MPRRDHVSLLLLLPFVLLPYGLAAAFLTSEPARFTSPAFDVAKELGARVAVGDLGWQEVWGLMFLAGAVVLTVGTTIRWVTGRAAPAAYGLMVGAGVFSFWTVQLAKNAWESPNVSATGPMYVGFVAALHMVAAVAAMRRQTHR